MYSSISNLIGSGTGVNSGQLLSDLVAATREPKEASLFAREQTNQTKISALASATSSLGTFATALTGLLNGRAFAGDLVSSEPSLVSVGFISDQKPQGLPATLEIDQVASARRLASDPVADSSASLGAGTLTISSGSDSFDMTLLAGADSLDDLAAGINSSDSGITASVVTDADGSRLILEGQEGASETFTVSGDFSDYNYPGGGSGLTLISDAADALINVDGIDLRYSNNNIDGAIPGVSLSLNQADPGTQIVITGDQPVSTVSNLVEEFVDAYNTLRTALNDATAPGSAGATGGPLAGNGGVRDMKRLLSGVTSTDLIDSGPYQRLSDIGVKTNNDGTLSIDKTRLDAALEADPDAVSNMLDPSVKDDNNPGIAGVISEIKDRLTADDGSLQTSKDRLEQIKEDLVDAREKLDEDSSKYQEQLQRTFANMDQQLAVLQATQSYLTQQIAAWSNSDG